MLSSSTIQAQIEDLNRKAAALTVLNEKVERLAVLIKECLDTVEGTSLEADFRKAIADLVFSESASKPTSRKRSKAGPTYREGEVAKNYIKKALGLEKQRMTPKQALDLVFERYENSEELIEQLSQELETATSSKNYKKFWLIAKEGIEKLAAQSGSDTLNQ